MAEIFLSYKKDDRALAEAAIAALEVSTITAADGVYGRNDHAG